MSLAYANPGSGPSAGGIGWVNFGSLTLKPGDSLTGVTGTLKDGTLVTFDIESLATSYVPITAIQPPSQYAFFGVSGYTGILGNVVLATPILPNYQNTTVVLSNITLTDSNGNPVNNYTAVVADAESTNSLPQYTEHLTFNTDGGNWNLLATVGGNPPKLTGTGSQSATITGLNGTLAASYVLTTQAPTTLTLETYGREAVAVGFAVTKVVLRKNIGERIDSNDQFLLDINGTPSDQVTTTGITTGVQNKLAKVFGLAGNSYSITESMSPGSINPLTSYGQIVSATNASLGGTIPPISPLPINVTTQLGDIIVYDILNTAPETFEKCVDKNYADVGDVITYTVTINNPNDFAVSNVVMTDSIPSGTSFVDILSVNPPSYSGTNPSTGITIPSIGANTSATISWRVKVNSTLPILNPITNVAAITVPGGTNGTTNSVTTVINHADLVSSGNFLNSANPTNINTGDTITYTLKIKNTGNAAANNVIITDPVPKDTTYIPGSITSNAVFTGNPTTAIKLTSPIAAGQTVTIIFKVKAGNTIPSTNPIKNQAEIDYTYTVNPACPNSVAINGFSNIVATTVSNATLITKKAVDKTIAYMCNIITYNIAVTNIGNVPANKVVINDSIPNCTVYVPCSLTVSAPYSGSPTTAIFLTDSIAPGETISISFKIKVIGTPNPNPINSQTIVDYAYTVNPQDPNGVIDNSRSNSVPTVVFKYNFSCQITDLVESIALEQAALAALANAEGAKIQAMVAMNSITPHDLLCLNKSVSDMLDSITILESILKQKLNTVNCQIAPPCI